MPKGGDSPEGTRLGVATSLTVSCYQADNMAGLVVFAIAAGCVAAGFAAAGLGDPTPYSRTGACPENACKD